MADVFDVAKYILNRMGEITAMKLQKLVYYSYVWTLVWDEESLFTNQIQAWANGAVIPDLYQEHKGLFKVNEDDFARGDKEALSEVQKENINKVIDFYGEYTAQQLSDINHQEDPWILARNGLPPLARSNSPITNAMILEYYSGISNGSK